MRERAVIANFTILYRTVEIRKDFFYRNFGENRTASSAKILPSQGLKPRSTKKLFEKKEKKHIV